MSDSDTHPCGSIRTVVMQTVSNVGEDPWCDTGDKATHNLANGSQLQCNEQDCIRRANDEQCTGALPNARGDIQQKEPDGRQQEVMQNLILQYYLTNLSSSSYSIGRCI